MSTTPINSRDIALQALPQRLITLNTNFISLTSPSLEFVYGSDNNPLPNKISVYAQLAGILQGNVTFEVTGLTPNTTLVLDTNNRNILILDPGTFSGYYVTVKASLIYGGITYSSTPMVISKRFTSLLTRITRTFDNVNSDANGTNYKLPIANNTLELYNGGTKLTKDIVFGIQGSLLNTVTVDGLVLNINRDTGTITVTNVIAPATGNQIPDSWTSDTVTFNLTATFSLTTYSTTYTVTKIRAGGSGKDTTPPPIPTNVRLTPGFSYIFVELDQATLTYSQGHGHNLTRVYAQIVNPDPKALQVISIDNIDTDPIATADDQYKTKLVAEFGGAVTSFNVLPGTEYRIWVKYVTVDGYASVNPYGGTTGQSVTSGQDVKKLVAAMTGEGQPFKVLTVDTYIDGVLYKAGTYATQSFIANAQISNAKIADATIDNAKIANISTDQITAGTGIIGKDLRSFDYAAGRTGWVIKRGGTAEFAAASIRDKLTADQIDTRGLTIRRADNTVLFDAGKTILEQIPRYAPGATSGSSLNLDPTCSNIAAWDAAYIKTISDGITGTKVLSGSKGDHLIEGITTANAFRMVYDQNKVYQISALIRKVGTVPSTTAVHLGLLEFDLNDTAQYSWGGYLFGKIVAANLTTEFKRQYVTVLAGSLNSKTVTMALHAILGYPDAGTGSIQIQDIRLDDITLQYNAFLASTATAATDSTSKTTVAISTAAKDATSKADTAKITAITTAAEDATTKANTAKTTAITTAITTAATDATAKANLAISTAASDATIKANTALSDAKSYADTAKKSVVDATLGNAVKQIMKTGFYLQTNGYDGVTVNGVQQPGSGFALYDGGLIAKKNNVNTFSLDSSGNAVFGGTIQIVNINPAVTSYLNITNDKLEVYNNGVKRVVLGKLN
jgi:hypothetical protein